MSVGTQGSVKGLTASNLYDLDAEIILANTYHMLLRPGLEGIERLGGLHKFINWQRPILTDSGGFQVFSLSKIRKMSDLGVEFRSHINGDLVWLGPKEAIGMQQALGSDIMMVLDECPPWDAEEAAVKKAVQRTIDWAQACYNHHHASDKEAHRKQLLFGIVQGGKFADLRKKCAEALQEVKFDGYAIGGVSVGEPEPEMYAAIEASVPHLPEDRPRYAMGLGHPNQLVEMVAQGVDMFDCVLPTRMARHGSVYTHDGMYDIRHARYQWDQEPLEPGCACPACQQHTRAYLRHLLKGRELTAMLLISLHNTYFYINLMKNIRRALEMNRFGEFRQTFMARYLASAATASAGV